MPKEFEAFRNTYLAHKDSLLQGEQLRLTTLEKESNELFNLGQKRISFNQDLFHSFGVKELFEGIKTENILEGGIGIDENISLLNDDSLKIPIKHILEWPDYRSIFEKKRQISRWVDSKSFIALSWDYEEGGDCGDLRYGATKKKIVIGASNSKLYLIYAPDYSNWTKTLEVKKNNLPKILTQALSQSKGGPVDNVRHFL